MWPFSRGYDLSAETIGWIEDNFDWAIRHGLLTDRTPLVTLSRTYFSAPSTKSPDFVLRLIKDIQSILGIADARISVLPLEQIDARFRHSHENLVSIGGTWQQDGNGALIRYDREQINAPVVLIGTLSHEVMHHVLHGIHELPPGGEETEELATDLHCITMGFGLFQMEAAERLGWQGYMRQPTRAHALGLFLRMRGIPESEALAHLSPRCGKYLLNALKWIDRNATKTHGILRGKA
jgi:hypothetical protein